MKTASKVLLYNQVTNSIVACHPTGRPWLIKGTKEPAKNVFNLPGGEIDGEENPEDAAVREIKEECSYDLDPKKLKHLGNYDYIKDKNWEIFFYPVDDSFNIKSLKCDSFFTTPEGKPLPEVNGFAWIELETKLDWINYAAIKVLKKVMADHSDLFSLEQAVDKEIEHIEETLSIYSAYRQKQVPVA